MERLFVGFGFWLVVDTLTDIEDDIFGFFGGCYYIAFWDWEVVLEAVRPDCEGVAQSYIF